MSLLDVVIILPLIYGAWIGFRKGFVIEVCTLLAFVLGVWGGITFSDFLTNGLREQFSWNSEYLPVISFLIIFLAVGAMVFFAGKAIEKLINLAAMKPLNKLAGLGFGIVKFLFVISVSLVILDAFDDRGEFLPASQKENSLLYGPVKDLSLTTLPALGSSELFQKTGGDQITPSADTTEQISRVD